MQHRSYYSVPLIALLFLFSFVPSVSAQGPSISVNPASGLPGSGVTVSGSGFVPNVSCDIVFGSIGVVASATTDGNGGLNAGFSVPAGAAPGPTPVQANCPQAQQFASTTFTVLPPPPPPTHVPPTNTPVQVQPTKTCQQLQNCTPTPTPTTLHPNDTPTPTETFTPTPSFTPASAASTLNPPPGPNGPLPPAPLFGGRLMMIPPWVYLVVGLWLIGLLGLITLWLLSGRSVNPGHPGGRLSPPPARKFWGGGVLLWLVIGLFAVVGRDLFPGSWSAICGIDNFPDLTVTNVEFAKSDFISFTVANIGPCKAPPSYGRLDWDTSEAKILAKVFLPPTPIDWLWASIPALASGETLVVKEIWSGSYGTFHSSTLVWGFTIDYQKKIMEEDEYNNTLIFRP